jgi:glycerophosphoryl diester phosphodiesterase
MSFSFRSRLLAVTATCVAPLALTLVATPADAAALSLHRGSHGAKVRLLESRLHRLDLLVASAVDGRYRAATVNSVKRFQRGAHLPVTGRVNQRTWHRIALAVSAPKRPTGPAPAIVGHRGAVGPGIPEDTLASMRRAAPWVAVLEFDLHLTSDHQLVLMHDATLDRTTNCTGAVSARTLQYLNAHCKVGREPIPTFDEVAAYAETRTLKIAPELKDVGISDADITQALEIIDAHHLQDRTIVQSFNYATLERVHALRPSIRLMLVSGEPVSIPLARKAGATTVAIQLENLTAPRVALYRRNGLKVWTYTAINKATLDQAHAIHVDAVITDVPGVAHTYYRPTSGRSSSREAWPRRNG